MATDLRIECPECGTSFRTDTLKLKTSPGNKAIVRCMCGVSLEAEFEEARQFVRSGWFRRAREVRTPAVTVRVTESV